MAIIAVEIIINKTAIIALSFGLKRYSPRKLKL